jgi:flagellar hook-length control protein FliK
MKFFEVLPKGVGQGLQKVAVKMPSGVDASGSADGTGFADLMAALMSLPADQLRQSLAQLDRVCVEGQSKEWVPLLDLTQASGANGGMLKLLQIDSQANNTAASMLQLKLQQMQTQEIAAQPEAEVLQQTTPLEGKNLAPQKAPAAAGNLQEEMADFFASVQTDGEEPTNPNKDLSAELARALTGRTQKTATADDQLLDPMPNLTDRTKEFQPKQMEQVPAKNPDVLTALQQQLTADGKDSFATVIEKKTARQRGSVAALKAASAAVAHAAAKSAVSEKPVDMSASLDKALAEQRPIQKEEKSVADGRLQAQAEAAGTPGTSQNAPAPASGQPVQSVESRLNSLETRPAQPIQQSGETQAAPKEMQTDVIRQIVQRMTLRSDGRNTSMQIKLKPEFLGNLHMEVVSENQQVTVRMTAENQAVKNIIEQNLHILKNELQQHGLQIQKFDVFVSQDNDAWRNGQQQAAFRQAQDRGHRSGSGRNGLFSDSEEAEAMEGATGTARSYGEKSSVDFFA